MAYIWAEQQTRPSVLEETFSQYAMGRDPAFTLSFHVQAS